MVTSGTTANLTGVSAPSASVCYVAGLAGKILKSINGGTSWSTQTTGTSEDLYAVHFVDTNTGFACGSNATAIKTTDGGTTWTPMPLPVTASVGFRNLYFIDANTGFIVGGQTTGTGPGTILKTINAGGSWSILTTTPASVHTLYSIFFTSPTIGYASEATGNILKTTNGGTSWIAVTSGIATPLFITCFTTANSGIVAGDNGNIRITNDAGASWSGVTSGSIDFLTGTDFYDSNNGVVVGGNVSANTGVILTTTDGGNSWSSYNPGTSRLYRIDFVNANLGFAVGLNGTILRYSSNVGINEKQSPEVVFNNYPNPFSNSSTIDLGDYHFLNEITVELYDISGKLVENIAYQKDAKIVIEKNNLNSGLYIYKVLDGNNYIGSGRMTIE